MQPDTAKRLLDALEAGRRFMQFTEGTTFDEYTQSALLRSAVERQFEIIGESLSKAAAVDPLLSEIIEELPRIVGLRNRLIHGYPLTSYLLPPCARTVRMSNRPTSSVFFA